MLQTLRKLLTILSTRERKRLVFVLLSMVLMGFFEVVGVGSIMPFISVVSEPDLIHTNEYLSWAYEAFGFTTARGYLLAFGIAVMSFLVFSNVSRALVSWVVHRYSSMRLHSIGYRLLRRYLDQPYVFFLNQNTSVLAKNILNEVTAVVNRFLLPSLEFASKGVIAISIVSLLFFVDPLLAALITGVLTTAYALVFLAVRRTLNSIGKKRLVTNSLRFKYATEAMSGIKDIKLLRKEHSFLRAYGVPSKGYAKAEVASAIIGEIPKYFLETIAFGGVLLIVLYLIQTRGNFNEIVPIISLYALAGYRLMPALQSLFRSLTKMRYSAPLVETLYDDLVGWEESRSSSSGPPAEPLPFRVQFDLRDIRFRYPNTDEPVIRDESISVTKNTTVGFVGPTGCGKTTLVDIVLGLLVPETGEVLVDGVPVDDDNRRNWQANLGYVPQHIYLTDDTIAKNIAFGVPSEELDPSAVERAARVANLHDFIANELHDGYETIVGERGIRLSGGQRQRIGIARAVYHDPDVLILDEATSALDNLTEQAIMDAIHNLSHQKTILMIAHRLSTVRECDVIYMMDHGKIVDSGGYDDLLARNASFRRMVEGK